MRLLEAVASEDDSRLLGGRLFTFLVSGLLLYYHYKLKKSMLFLAAVTQQPRIDVWRKVPVIRWVWGLSASSNKHASGRGQPVRLLPSIGTAAVCFRGFFCELVLKDPQHSV